MCLVRFLCLMAYQLLRVVCVYYVDTGINYVDLLRVQRYNAHVRGAFNKFPDFFCTGIENCCRLLKFQYVMQDTAGEAGTNS